MSHGYINSFLLFFSLVSAWQAAFAAEDKIFTEDIYGEDALPAYKETGEGWKEEDLVLPPYPVAAGLIEVDLGIPGLDFSVLIDPESLSLGKDRVLRYTLVLRSEDGVDNVSYEGLRCANLKYRRYAYGGNGEFHAVGNSEWRFIRRTAVDRYRTALAKNFFCPLPMGDARRQIVQKMKRTSPATYIFDNDE